jgi:large subunit ribosomal protein L1
LLSNAQLIEIVKKGKESKERKFPESVEAIITFKEVDPKKNDLNINETVYLPHPGSHKASVCFIGSGDLLLRARNAGADGVLEPSQLENYAGNKREAKNLASRYDFFLAETALMPRIGKVLGRTRSAVRVRSRASMAVGAKVGDRKLSDSDLADNIQAVVQAVQRKLPNGDRNIRSIIVKTSMGKPVRGKVDES